MNININLNDNILFQIYKGVVTEKEGNEIEIVHQNGNDSCEYVYNTNLFNDIPSVGDRVTICVLISRDIDKFDKINDDLSCPAFKDKGVSGPINL